MTHRFSEAEIQAALKDVTPEGAERSRAMRSLPDFKKNDPTIDVTENNIRLYLALKKLSPSGRVSLAQMKSQKTMAVASTMIRSKVWLVPRQNFPTIPPEFAKFSVPPESQTSLPIDIDPQTIWAFDQAVSREKLGRGIFELELSFGNMSKVKHGLLEGTGSMPASSQALPDKDMTQGKDEADSQGPPGPPAKKPRVLQEHVSETEEESFERIAKATKEAGGCACFGER